MDRNSIHRLLVKISYKKCPIKISLQKRSSFSISIPQYLLELFFINFEQSKKWFDKMIGLFIAAELRYNGKRLKLN